ncbi:MAG: hypothetical protein IJU52_05335 [Clostridia bacterium]|nr:hypothetical protein [Clostridia bacterium]
MKKEKISAMIGTIRDEYVIAAGEYDRFERQEIQARRLHSGRTVAAKRSKRTKIILLAACMLLMLALSATGFAFLLAEAKEYKDAVTFFEENGLSMEGLSRAEVKEVYRDIITERFEDDKTVEVIKKAVEGTEIEQDVPIIDGSARSWWRWYTFHSEYVVGDGYHMEYVRTEEGYRCRVKYLGEDLTVLWSADLPACDGMRCIATPIGTAVCGSVGERDAQTGAYTHRIFAARIDGEGNILWQKAFEHGFQNEVAVEMLNDGDGVWALISEGDDHLCFGRIDENGNELLFRTVEIGEKTDVSGAARIGDGYLVRLRDSQNEEYARLIRLDRDGEAVDRITYESEDCFYYLTDMIEFGGRIYLSAYAVPKREDNVFGRSEIALIIKYCWEYQDRDPDNADWIRPSGYELTPVVRDNYTAVLLRCDAAGTPETFYEVAGSFGGKLRINEYGELVWKVETVNDAVWLPGVDMIEGTCAVFRYCFDASGALCACVDINETVTFEKRQ